MDTTTTLISLATPTNRTTTGPTILKDRDRLVIEYDYESDDGQSTNARLTFTDVIAFQYRDSACCDPESIVDARVLRALGASSWLNELVNRWSESVGWQQWQQQRGGEKRFRHFTAFFDDSACIDVVAAEVAVD